MRSLTLFAACLILLSIPKLASADFLYVSNGSSSTVDEYSTSPGAAINASLNSGLSNPRGMVIDVVGVLYLANYFNETIGDYNASTCIMTNASLICGFLSPEDLALDGSGNFYVANLGGLFGQSNANSITRVAEPTGLVLNGSGDL